MQGAIWAVFSAACTEHEIGCADQSAANREARATVSIPAFEADDGTQVQENNGLIAYSESEEHCVLQFD